MISAIFKAIYAAITCWNAERKLQNNPAVVKALTAQRVQDVRDKLAQAETVLGDPNATPQAHAEALKQLRLSQS